MGESVARAGQEMMKARIALVWTVKTVLHNALEDILAVSAPERM